MRQDKADYGSSKILKVFLIARCYSSASSFAAHGVASTRAFRLPNFERLHPAEHQESRNHI